jgi:hypothetical protein
MAIVKVLTVHGEDYEREVCKYTVKGTDLARWPAREIADYINAIKGIRLFGTFGAMYKRTAEFKAYLEELQAETGLCECGSNSFEFLSEDEWDWQQLKSDLAPPLGTAPARRDWQLPLPTL